MLKLRHQALRKQTKRGKTIGVHPHKRLTNRGKAQLEIAVKKAVEAGDTKIQKHVNDLLKKGRYHQALSRFNLHNEEGMLYTFEVQRVY